MVKVRVPATSANMGPGFDCIGIALGLYNYIEIEQIEGSNIIIQNNIRTQNPVSVENNLIRCAAARVYEACGKPCPAFYIKEKNTIPASRGLGSSAACIIGGMVGANKLLGSPLNRSELIHLATKMEGHPDNVVPCFLGGIGISYWDGDRVTWSRARLPQGIRMIMLIPPYTTKTVNSRKGLPETVSHKDAAFNTAHAALLVASLMNGNTVSLKEALKDRLHQPYRLPSYALPENLFQTITNMGALGAYLSGSGSTIGVLADKTAPQLENDLRAYFSEQNIDLQVKTLRPDISGAVIQNDYRKDDHS